MKNINRKKYIWLFFSIVIFAASYFAPSPEGLEVGGKQAVFLLVIALILLLSKCVDIGVAGVLLFVLQPIMGVVNLASSLSIWSMTSTWFLVASFGLAGVIASTSWPRRILSFLIKICGYKTGSLLLGIMCGTAFLSMWMSDVPACAIPAGFSMVLINAIENPDEKKKIARSFMIGIPMASYVGGMGTPAGSGANVIALDMLNMHTNGQFTVTWVQWLAVGIPLVVIVTPILWFILMKVFPLPQISDDVLHLFLDSTKTEDKMDGRDIKFVVIMLTAIVLWILSSWIPILSTTLVALCMLAVFVLAGVSDMKYILGAVPWTTMMLAMGFGSVANALNSTMLVNWAVDKYLVMPAAINIFVLFIVIGIIIALAHIPLPGGASLIRLFSGPIILAGLFAGVHPSAMTLLLCFSCSTCFLLPLDTVAIVTFGYGHYSFKDYARPGVVATILMIVFIAIWLPIILKPLGLLMAE